MIWLLRHGEAEDAAADDAARRLTPKGERQAHAAGAALAALGVGITACLTSPKVRALDTARLACEALGIEPEVVEALRGGDFDPAELAAGRGEVLLVGHEWADRAQEGRPRGDLPLDAGDPAAPRPDPPHGRSLASAAQGRASSGVAGPRAQLPSPSGREADTEGAIAHGTRASSPVAVPNT